MTVELFIYYFLKLWIGINHIHLLLKMFKQALMIIICMFVWFIDLKLVQLDFWVILGIQLLQQLQNVFEMRRNRMNITRGFWKALIIIGLCYDFSYFVLFTYVFSLFLEVSHGAATLTHFSLTHIAATLLTHSTSVVLTHSIAILIALPHWCSIYSGQSCRLFFS